MQHKCRLPLVCHPVVTFTAIVLIAMAWSGKPLGLNHFTVAPAAADETGAVPHVPADGAAPQSSAAVPEGDIVAGKVVTLKVDLGRVRAAPSLDADIRFKLLKGRTVSVIDARKHWYRIQLEDGRTGWAHKSLFSAPGQVPMATASAPSPVSAAIAADTPHSSIYVVEKAVPPPVAQKGEPAQQVVSGRTATVKVPVGRVRSNPTLDAPILSRLAFGTTVPVIGTEGQWFRIVLDDGRNGWAHQRLFLKQGEALPAEPVTPAVAEIREIYFVETPEGTEAVTFLLNGYFPPNTYQNTTDGPKLICEFPNARLNDGVQRLLSINGNFIEQIRVAVVQGAKPGVKVVVDLVPVKNYAVRPVFFRKDKTFALIVQKAE